MIGKIYILPKMSSVYCVDIQKSIMFTGDVFVRVEHTTDVKSLFVRVVEPNIFGTMEGAELHVSPSSLIYKYENESEFNKKENSL